MGQFDVVRGNQSGCSSPVEGGTGGKRESERTKLIPWWQVQWGMGRIYFQSQGDTMVINKVAFSDGIYRQIMLFQKMWIGSSIASWFRIM